MFNFEATRFQRIVFDGEGGGVIEGVKFAVIEHQILNGERLPRPLKATINSADAEPLGVLPFNDAIVSSDNYSFDEFFFIRSGTTVYGVQGMTEQSFLELFPTAE